MNVSQRRHSVAAAPTIYAERAYGLALTDGTASSWACFGDDSGRWQLPVILSPIEGGGFEASSPYGYAGVYAERALPEDELSRLWQETLGLLQAEGVVSLFLRFPPFTYPGAEVAQLSGLASLAVELTSTTIEVGTEQGVDVWAGMEGRARTAVRKAKKLGMQAEIGPVQSVHTERLVQFRELYERTMTRIGASTAYLYPDSYYQRLVSDLGSRVMLASVTDSAAQPAATALLLLDNDVVHYHLSGSDPSAARDGANNLLLWSILEWANHQGYKSVHLGGGLKPGDSLFKFKRSFGGTERDFHIGKVIVDPAAYGALVAARASQLGVDALELATQKYFPAFRADISHG